MRRLISIFTSVCLLFVLVVPVSASSAPDIPVGGFSGTYSLRTFRAVNTSPSTQYINGNFSWPSESNSDPITYFSTAVAPGLELWALNLQSSVSDPSSPTFQPTSGLGSVYASWYFTSSYAPILYGTGSATTHVDKQVYINYSLANPPMVDVLLSESVSDAVTLSSDDVELTSFDVAVTSTNATPGFRISATMPADTPIYSIRIYRDLAPEMFPFSSAVSAGNAPWMFYLPSVSYVVFDDEETKEALERIADLLVEQNEVLSAMYADIMVLLNNLYSRLGDMEAVLRTANTTLSTISSRINTTNTRLTNIYNVLNTYLHYLQDISETADDIQAELMAFHKDFLRSDDYLGALGESVKGSLIAPNVYLSEGFLGLGSILRGSSGSAYSALVTNSSDLSESAVSYSNILEAIVAGFNSMQSDLAKLRYVLASDDDIEIRQKGQPVRDEIVNDFVGDSAAAVKPGDVGDMAGVSGDVQGQLDTGVGFGTGFGAVTSDDNFSFWSAETQAQLNTSVQTFAAEDDGYVDFSQFTLQQFYDLIGKED